MKNHTLYTLCYHAHYNTSHTPEKRAESEISSYEAQLEEFKKLCKDDVDRYQDIVEKFTKKFTALMQAKSRCASSMITGPANFPTSRNEKAYRSRHNRGEEMLDFIEKVKNRIYKEENPSTDISSDDPEAIEKLKLKLKMLKSNHEKMKACNAVIRKKSLPDEEKIIQVMEILGSGREIAQKLLKPGHCCHYGFAGFELSNNNATMKTVERRIKEIETRNEKEAEDFIVNGVRILENTEANRIQLYFPDKPAEEMRSLLKSKGFRWSPRFGAWQRMLNGNGRYATKQILKVIKT